MISTRTMPLLAALGMLAACDSADTRSPGITGPGDTPLLAMQGVTSSATGSGHYMSNGGGFADADGAWRTFSFNARARAGTVSGKLEHRNRAGDSRVHGDITCLTVVDNQAWVGGVVTHATNPAYIGREFGFSAIDNGEGAGSPPDQLSVLALGSAGVADLFCTDLLNFGFNAIEAGNIQVR